MKVGDLAHVVYVSNPAHAGTHNVLRDARWQPIGGIPVGTVVELLEGPRQHEGLRYWRVFCPHAWDQKAKKWSPMEGWTAEGQLDAVWLDAVPVRSVCNGTYATRLSLGRRAYVRRGQGGLRLRTEPDKDQDPTIAGKLSELAVLRLVEGPVCADQMVWWRAVAEQATGTSAAFHPADAYWVSEGQGSTYFLAPLDVPPIG